jgi:cell division initiation protein
MDLTPRLLTEVEFREQWRGYNPDDVESFLQRVAVAVGELQEQLREATERASVAERRLLDRSDEDEIRRTLVLAQRTSLAAVEEARAEAERILLDANERAQQQLAEAEERLAALEEEIAERTRSDLAELAARREALQADVDGLEAFVDEHRSRLRAELERQLAELDAPRHDLSVPEPPALHDVDLEVPEHDPIELPEPEAVAPPITPIPPMHAPTEAEVAQAREDLLEALRRAGVDALLAESSSEPEVGLGSETGAEAAEPTPEPESAASPTLYDADADDAGAPALGDGTFEPTGAFDVLADLDDLDGLDEGGDDDLQWRHRTGETAAIEDDPFLAELRRAVTDTEPLGPRDVGDLVDLDGDHEGASASSGRRRLRRSR